LCKSHFFGTIKNLSFFDRVFFLSLVKCNESFFRIKVLVWAFVLFQSTKTLEWTYGQKSSISIHSIKLFTSHFLPSILSSFRKIFTQNWWLLQINTICGESNLFIRIIPISKVGVCYFSEKGKVKARFYRSFVLPCDLWQPASHCNIFSILFAKPVANLSGELNFSLATKSF